MKAIKENEKWVLVAKLPTAWTVDNPPPAPENIKDFEDATIGENQKRGDLYLTENDVVTYKVVNLTEEEIEERTKQIKNQYRALIYKKTDALVYSAKCRALGKVGQGLTTHQLDNLKLRYTLKKNVALQYITDGTIIDAEIFNLFKYEVVNDFQKGALDATIDYLNETYNANIPTDATDLIKYCFLIITKFNLGSHLDSVFNSMIETFRSKLITNLDNLEFDVIDTRFSVISELNNDSTLEDIQNIKNKFDTL